MVSFFFCAMIKTDKSLTEAVDMKRGVVLATMGMLVLFLVVGCNKRGASKRNMI